MSGDTLKLEERLQNSMSPTPPPSASTSHYRSPRAATSRSRSHRHGTLRASVSNTRKRRLSEAEDAFYSPEIAYEEQRPSLKPLYDDQEPSLRTKICSSPRYWSVQRKVCCPVVVTAVLVITGVVPWTILKFGKRASLEWRASGSMTMEHRYCTHSDCERIKSSILATLDGSRDPCTSFYDYACGSWLARNSAPGHSLAEDIMNDTYRQVLDYRIDPDSPISIQKAQIFYKSCINQTDINSRGFQPILWALGGLKNASLSAKRDSEYSAYRFNLQGVLEYLESMSANPFTFVETSTNILKIDFRQAFDLGSLFVTQTSQDSSVQQAVMAVQLDFLMNVRHAMGHSRAESLEWATSVLHYTSILYPSDSIAVEYTPPRPYIACDDSTQCWMTLSDFQELCDIIHWTQFLERFIPSVDPASLKFWVTDPYHVAQVNTVLQTDIVALNESRALYSFFEWQLIDIYLQLMAVPLELQELHHKYRTSVRDILQTSADQFSDLNRSDLCLKLSDLVFGDVIRQAVAVKTVNDAIIQQVRDMIDKILLTQREYINQSHWMDQETKANALEKMAGMKSVIGYIADDVCTANRSALIAQNLTIEDGINFENVRNLLTFLKLTHVLQLAGDDVDTGVKIEPTSYYDVSYRPDDKTLILPANTLQLPYFSQHIPSYLKYGALGTVIAKTTAKEFTETGFSDWWRSRLAFSFADVNHCFEGNVLNALHSNVNYLNAVGFRTAYEAYRKVANTSEDVLCVINGLGNFTPEQLFFISSSQILCSTDDFMPNRTSQPIGELPTVHTYSVRDRVHKVVMNSAEFAAAFHCPVGSPMNPSVKCRT